MPGFFELRKMDWEKLTSVSMRAESLGIDLDLNENLCFKILVVAVIISDKTILNNSGSSYIYKVNSRFILFLVTTDKKKQCWLVEMEKKEKKRICFVCTSYLNSQVPINHNSLFFLPLLHFLLISSQYLSLPSQIISAKTPLIRFDSLA